MKFNSITLLVAGLLLVASRASMAADELTCDEQGMTFSYDNTTMWAFVNLLKLDSWTSDPVQRFRKSVGNTISQCGSGVQSSADKYSLTMKYTDCAGGAISIEQSSDVIKREAIVEIQPNANHGDPVLRHLNYTQWKLTCEYTRQINMSNSFNVSVKPTITKVELTMQATFDIKMDLYMSNQFKVKASSPQEVTLNEPLYVELQKTWNDTNLKMVVENCWATDTQDQSGEFKYSFLSEGCPLDPTYSTLKETENIFQFQINAFVFIKLKSQTYLHCSLYVCDKDSTTAKCQLGCQNNRKRRSIEGDLSRERRAVSTAPLEMGRAVSSQIKYTPKPTCASVKTWCPSNSVCVENYPAYCRCNGNLVMDIHTNKCTDKNLVEMNVPTKLTWINQYKQDQSSEFLRIAKMYEQKMVGYYVKKVNGINGMKIVAATQDDGAVVFRVIMALADATSMERVSQQIQDLLAYRSEEVVEKTQVNPSTIIKIVPVFLPVQTVNKQNTSVSSETRDMVLVGVGVLISLFVVFAIYIRRSRKKEPVQIVHVNSSFDAVKVVPKDNKGYGKF